jgi:alpha-galactosidase
MKSSIIFNLVGTICILSFETANAWKNGLGLTPPMGWTNTYAYGKALTEDIVMQTANYMNTTGILDAGYKIITLGDGWQNDARESNGDLLANPTRFPNGMASLGTKLKGMGFNLGVSSSPGKTTCMNALPGSEGYESKDASNYASWGVSFLNYYNCGND